MNISKLMTFIFRNKTLFWNILKWNRGQKNWDGWISILQIDILYIIYILFLIKKKVIYL